MIEDEERRAFDEQPRAANDNGHGELRPRIDAALIRIAQLIGRQIAREDFERQAAANDNSSPESCDD